MPEKVCTLALGGSVVNAATYFPRGAAAASSSRRFSARFSRLFLRIFDIPVLPFLIPQPSSECTELSSEREGLGSRIGGAGAVSVSFFRSAGLVKTDAASGKPRYEIRVIRFVAASMLSVCFFSGDGCSSSSLSWPVSDSSSAFSRIRSIDVPSRNALTTAEGKWGLLRNLRFVSPSMELVSMYAPP